MRETRSTCCYCGVGCGVLIAHDGAQITGVRGDPDHPANFGRLCTKGATLHLTAAAHVAQQTRLLRPMRRPARGAAPVPVPWDVALDEAADRLAAIHATHGPDALGVYVSGQLLTEDYAVFNKLVKGLLGSNHLDTNSRLCMSSAVAGYKATLGADAPPACYDDLAHARTVFIAGSNLAWAHPILMRRLEDARRAAPDQRWIVVDPRRTETAEAADLHLALLPGSDVALYHGLLHLLLWEGLTDAGYIAAHTEGFDRLRARVRECTPRATARATGLPEADLITAARWFGGHTPTLSLYCQGLNQSRAGTANNAALINLHLATGQIGRPGAGPLSLTGQPNAMGGREVGGMATLLSGHRDLADPAHRAEVAALWGVADVPSAPGRTAIEMFQAAADGEVKALWIACTNPAHSLPDQATVRRAFERAEFVLVQEACATTATAALADLLLPATTWGEKDGTVTNSERRISRVRAAVPPAGQARHDWEIARAIGLRLAARLAPDRAHLFDAATPEAIWAEHRAATRGRDLDISGLSYAMLDAHGPQQWPVPEGAGTGTARLYTDGRFATPDGRARFADVAPTAPAEPRDARYPFSLNTGRLRDQWHGMSRTGTLGRLYGHDGWPAVELHPHALQRLRLDEGMLVHVRSRRGEVVLPVRGSDRVAPTQAFIAMHWGAEALLGRDRAGRPAMGVNALTTPAACPQSRQPELKHAAVAIEAAQWPWHLAAEAWLRADEALARREQLKPWLADLAFAAVVPFGREEAAADASAWVGLRLQAAAAAAPPRDHLAALRTLLGLTGEGVSSYDDPHRGTQRLMRIAPAVGPGTAEAGAPRLAGWWLASQGAPDAAGAAWLRGLLEQGAPLPGPAHTLLAPGAHARLVGGATARPRVQVCSCLDVDAARIDAALRGLVGPAEARLAQLQATLRCGTQCGSCLPAVRERVRQAVQASPDPAPPTPTPIAA